jgi:signal transduction histidine kinase/CheY-like chemotaxis protein
MPVRTARTLKSKLFKITASIMLVMSVVTLSVVAWMNYATENERLAESERHIRQSIFSKGSTLAESHAMALKPLVMDNAFSDVRNLVSRAVEKDSDIVYALFLSAENKAWAYVSPSTQAAGSTDVTPPSAWIELGLDTNAFSSTELAHRKVSLFGKDIQEFAAAVIGDDHERLGTLVYGLSDERTRQVVDAARERSRSALLNTLAAIAGLGLCTFLLGTMMANRAAAQLTAPIADLTSTANEIAQGRRGVRALIRSGDEVEVLAAAFNHMLEANEDALHKLEATTERALAADRAKSEFLANMSHEIRTPMNGVLGMVRLMQTRPLDGKLARYVQTIDASANALLTIINDVLDFSKLEAGKYEIQSVRFEPKVVIQEVSELLASRAHDKQIELIYRVDPSIPSFSVGDPDRFRQVLNNLVGNAIKFTDEGEVFLNASVASAGPDHALLRVAVHDTGIGIDRADLPKLCEVFSQVDASMVRRHGGTGLGLAISKRLVNAMGGDIQVESEVGVGSVFTFTVRVGLDARTESRSSQTDVLPGKRVMLVEANPRWRDVIAEHLSAWGIEYEVAEAGETMLDRLTAAQRGAKPFDVVVIGMDVHDMSASDLVKRVRRHPTVGPLPVILLTTLRSDISLTDIEREFVTQLQKPIRFSELYNCLAGSFSGSFKEGPVAQVRPAHASGGRKVLVVDDNEINQFVATEELERLGYQVEIAANGLEAVDKIKRGGFSAVLMDCQMPGMDGYTATREIRKWERETGARHTPIVALTAHALVDERARVFAAGMDDYLSKPFRAASLEKILAQCVKDEERAPLPTVELATEIKRSEKLTTLFLDKVPSQLEALAAAIDGKNAAEVKALAHKLKGSCLAIAAGPMAEAAESLQKAGHQGDLSNAAAMLADLCARHARVVKLLRDELAAKRSVNGRPRESSRPA